MAEQEQTVDQQQEKAREKAEDDRYQRAEQQQAAYDDEYESRRETLSALALFQQDSVEQLAGGSRQNRRDYYQKLLSRLYIELRDLGASMLAGSAGCTADAEASGQMRHAGVQRGDAVLSDAGTGCSRWRMPRTLCRMCSLPNASR